MFYRRKSFRNKMTLNGFKQAVIKMITQLQIGSNFICRGCSDIKPVLLFKVIRSFYHDTGVTNTEKVGSSIIRCNLPHVGKCIRAHQR